jgi:hypothetical protein
VVYFKALSRVSSTGTEENYDTVSTVDVLIAILSGRILDTIQSVAA